MEKNQSIQEDFSFNVFKNFNDLYFNPEIEKRRSLNQIQEPFSLLAAQVIFPANGENSIVRINEEVKASIILKKGVSIEGVFNVNKEQVEKIVFDDKDFLDCGHATMILFNDGYRLTFDFIYNKDTCKKHLTIANEFLQSAQFALKNSFNSAFVDNCFSTVELLAKCKLLLETNQSVNGKTNHKAIKTEFNKRYKIDQNSFDINYKQIFNKLSDLRSNARYLNGAFSISEDDKKIMLEILESMYNEINMHVN